jgi:hypothetical protein
MARSKLLDIKQDIINDDGSVLFSFVQGEQLEFAVTLEFLTDVSAGYTFEAVVIEADNIPDQTEPPRAIKTAGKQTVLNVRVPVIRGAWVSGSAYNREDVVSHNGTWWRLQSTGITSTVAPDLDARWIETDINIVYVQFLATLGDDWAQAAKVDIPVYGFFEVRVTEPSNPIFTRTWKPVRGLVELLFSPTEAVPDGV